MSHSAEREDGRFASDEPPTCPPEHSHAEWCYASHGCKCRSCRNAWAAARRRGYRTTRARSGDTVAVGAAPLRRRLQALAVIGYGLGELAELTGMNRGNLAEIRRGARRSTQVITANKIIAIYRRLYMTPSQHDQAKVVTERALKCGYKSPLHWANIDKGTVDDDEW